jgi:hypothetical protein
MRRQNFRSAFFGVIGKLGINFSGVAIVMKWWEHEYIKTRKPGSNEHRLFYGSIQLILLPEQSML